MHYQKVIEQLGYSSREAKVYLASLRLGEAHISDLAEKVDMPRTSVQAIVDRLHADGLLTFYIRRRYKYWVAENPVQILFNLQKKAELLQTTIPSLVEIRRQARQKSYNKQPEESISQITMGFAQSLQPVLVFDDECEIRFANLAWEQLYGYSQEEIQGKDINILASEKTPKAVYRNMWSKLNKRRLFQSSDIFDKKKNGTIFPIRTSIFSVRYGGVYFFVQIVDDSIEE